VKTRIYIIKSNPPRRYCTKVVPVRLAIPCWQMCKGLADYIAAFNDLNRLKD
jgi:hypothetical protein